MFIFLLKGSLLFFLTLTFTFLSSSVSSSDDPEWSETKKFTAAKKLLKMRETVRALNLYFFHLFFPRVSVLDCCYLRGRDRFSELSLDFLPFSEKSRWQERGETFRESARKTNGVLPRAGPLGEVVKYVEKTNNDPRENTRSGNGDPVSDVILNCAAVTSP